MIVRLVDQLAIHKLRSFADDTAADTVGGELAETSDGVMTTEGEIHNSEQEVDVKIIDGEYAGYWSCTLLSDAIPVSALELLALEAE